MNRKLLAAAVLAATAVLTSTRTARAEPAPAAARERTDALLAAFKKVPAEAPKATAQQAAAREKQFETLDGFFDLDLLTREPIAPRADKMNGDQMKRFKSRFRDLLRRIAYSNSGEFFRKAQVKLRDPSPKGESVGVLAEVRVPSDDLETTVEFVWASSGGGPLKIVDVYFEGDSLVRDYQNQIARVVDKSGPDGLLKVLDERWAELEKPKGK